MLLFPCAIGSVACLIVPAPESFSKACGWRESGACSQISTRSRPSATTLSLDFEACQRCVSSVYQWTTDETKGSALSPSISQLRPRVPRSRITVRRSHHLAGGVTVRFQSHLPSLGEFGCGVVSYQLLFYAYCTCWYLAVWYLSFVYRRAESKITPPLIASEDIVLGELQCSPDRSSQYTLRTYGSNRRRPR
jgi:hypothetical protein